MKQKVQMGQVLAAGLVGIMLILVALWIVSKLI
jgi:hypothetical protein